MNGTATISNASAVETLEGLTGAIAHSQVYHIQCGRCAATTVRDVNHDTVRIICPACSRRLTLPATITATCSTCRSECEYPHTLAGHSTACRTCGKPVMLGPVVGRAESRSRSAPQGHAIGHGYNRLHHRPKRTIAFSEGAERSLVLIVAAIATLIFVVIASLQ